MKIFLVQSAAVRYNRHQSWIFLKRNLVFGSGNFSKNLGHLQNFLSKKLLNVVRLKSPTKLCKVDW